MTFWSQEKPQGKLARSKDLGFGGRIQLVELKHTKKKLDEQN